MMDILLIAQYGKSGGTRTYFKQLMEYLFLNRYKVVIAIDKKDYDDEIKELIAKYNFATTFINSKKVTLFDKKAINNIITMIKELFIVIKLKIKFRFRLLLISSGSHSYFISSFLLPIRLCFVLHTIPDRKENKLLRFILDKFIKSNKRMITVSNAAKSETEKCMLNIVDCPNIEVISNYYPDEDMDKERNINKDKVNVLTLGHVINYKNPYFCIEVAKKLYELDLDINFIWAGDGSELEVCKNKVKELGINNIQFIGHENDVQILYNNADIYFQCSLRESQGISILGAMANSLPCVGTNVGGIPEIILHNVNGFIVDKEDVNSAVKYISQLARDKKLRDIMGEKSLNIYKSNNSKEKWIERMDKLLKKYSV